MRAAARGGHATARARRGNLTAVRHRLAQMNLEGFPFTEAHHFDVNGLAGLEAADHALQLRNAVHALTCRRDDDVAHFDASLACRAVFSVRTERLHLRAANVTESSCARIRRLDFRDLDPEHRAPNFAVGANVLHHGFRERDRNRESVSGVEAGRV